MIVEYEIDGKIETLDTDNLDNDSGDPWSLEMIKKYLADIDPAIKNVVEV